MAEVEPEWLAIGESEGDSESAAVRDGLAHAEDVGGIVAEGEDDAQEDGDAETEAEREGVALADKDGETEGEHEPVALNAGDALPLPQTVAPGDAVAHAEAAPLSVPEPQNVPAAEPVVETQPVADGEPVGDARPLAEAEALLEGVCVCVDVGVGGTHAVTTTLPAVPLAPAAADWFTRIVALKESTYVASTNELPPPPPA